MDKKRERVTVGPFTWEHEPDTGLGIGEVWRLIIDKDVMPTSWCVKNYGGHPDDHDHGRTGWPMGWRLVSGGPFTDAGGWTSREDAMRGVIPWMIARIRCEITEARERAARREAAIVSWESELWPGAR